MEWAWVHERTTARRCPLCGNEGPHRVVIHYRAPYRDNPPRDLLRCVGCRSMFLDDLSDPPHIEDSPEVRHHTNFYVEVGAGIDVMAELFYALDTARVRDYLEIGCGFGFLLDFARRVFGWRVTGIDPGVIARAGKEMLVRARDVIRAVYRIDVGTPAALGLEELPPLRFSDVGDHMPFCLGCVLFFRGIGLMQRGRYKESVGFFRVAATAALAVRRALHTITCDDGDCENAWQQSRVHLPVALCHVDPNQAIDALAEIAGPAPTGIPDPLWVLPPPLLARARQETFSHLVSLGHYQAAAAIVGMVSEVPAERLLRAAELPVGERRRVLEEARRVLLFEAHTEGGASDLRPPERGRERVEQPAQPPVSHIRLHRRLTYRLVARGRDWHGVDVLIGTHREHASGRLDLTVQSPGGKAIRTATADLTDARDNDWLRFDFAPIVDAPGRPFLLRFTLADRGGSTRISLYELTADGTSVAHRLTRRFGLGFARDTLYCRMRYRREGSA